MTNHESGGLLRRLSRAFAALRRGITGSSSGTAPAAREPEFEPVHGWTRRQLDDYLWRNPDYRPAYDVLLRKCGSPASWTHPVPEGLPATGASEKAPRMLK
jgi:hypothetical protein